MNESKAMLTPEISDSVFALLKPGDGDSFVLPDEAMPHLAQLVTPHFGTPELAKVCAYLGVLAGFLFEHDCQAAGWKVVRFLESVEPELQRINAELTQALAGVNQAAIQSNFEKMSQVQLRVKASLDEGISKPASTVGAGFVQRRR